MRGYLPSLPLEDRKDSRKLSSSKPSSSSSAKAVKPQRHTSKRASPHIATAHGERTAQGASAGRHKRVWKACERCRMRKTRCDGEFPCKRCKDDGLFCTASVRKKTEYKQLPEGYAEVLEHTQVALVATVHKLYAMVRNRDEWDLGEPGLNDCGQPVIHNIASKLGCLRPNRDIDLPIPSVFPEDEDGMVELARQLEERQKERKYAERASKTKLESQSNCGLSHPSSPSEQDHSDFEVDCKKQVFGGANVTTLASQSFGGYDGLYADPVPTPSNAAAKSPSRSQAMASYKPEWTMALRLTSMDLAWQFITASGLVDSMDLQTQSPMESEFGTINPHILSCPNPEVMTAMGDPIWFSGDDMESMRL